MECPPAMGVGADELLEGLTDKNNCHNEEDVQVCASLPKLEVDVDIARCRSACLKLKLRGFVCLYILCHVCQQHVYMYVCVCVLYIVLCFFFYHTF